MIDTPPRKKPTQFDVARAAGVSQTTVSLVLNNPETTSVPAETRQRVLDAIQHLAYRPNTAARTLRTRKTLTLACVIPAITNPFYPAFVHGMQAVAEQNGYEVVIFNTDARPEKEARVVQSLMLGRADGVVGVFFHTSASELLPLLEMGMAVARLEARRPEAGDWPLDSLFVDNAAAARQVVAHLLERGFCRVAMITGPAGPRQARREGYVQALAAHTSTLSERVIEAPSYDEAGGFQAMRQLLADGLTFPQAIFAANDLMAFGAMKAIHLAGLHIPEDVAVAGFDDIPAAELVTPMLTTIRQFQDSLGRRAAQLVLERLASRAPSAGLVIEMPFELVVREST